MANMRFCFDNLIDYTDVVITAGTEDADLPVANVANQHRTKVYRTGTSTAAETILFDFVTAKAVQSVIILDHDLTASDSLIKLQGNATDSWGSPSVDETITYNANVMAKFLSAAQTYRYWRVIFTKSASGETRDIGRIFIGPYYEATKNVAYGDLEIVPVDLSNTDRSVGGQTYSEVQSIYHEIKAGFRLITETQMNSFRTIAAAVGTHTPFFISIDPTNKTYDWIYYVKFSGFVGEKAQTLQSGVYYWNVSLGFNEEL